MSDQLYRVISKEDLTQFGFSLRENGTIYAPVKTSAESHSFRKVDSLTEVDLDYNRTMIPPKKFFISPKETIFTFNKEEEAYHEVPAINEPMVLFGVHPCDLNALNLLAKVYLESFTDKYYSERRDKTTIIGISCTPDENCFCKSTGTDFARDGFELFFHDIGESYLVRVGSLKGYRILDEHKSFFRDATEADIEQYRLAEKQRLSSFEKSVEMSGIQDLLDMSYNSDIWSEYGEKCLSCGSCNLVCPRCRCYDVQDYIDLNLNTGERERRWYSCMLKEHGLVAGGHNFRATSADRLRNRVNCKGSLKEDMMNCVGCGRCTTYCPAEIDFVEILQKVRGDLK